MTGTIAQKLRAAFAIEGPESLLAAQLNELRGQLPIIYFGMVGCGFFVAALFFERAPLLIGGLWTAFALAAFASGLHWSRLDPTAMPLEAKRRELRRLRLFAMLLAAFCTLAVFGADTLALPHERTALILFVAFCGVGATVSLAVFKPASRIALTATCLPYPAYVAFTQDGAAQVVAITILVSVPVGLRQYGRIGDFFRALTLQNETAAARRRLAEERQRSFLESATDWAWEMDAERRLTYISSNFAAFIGRPEADLLGLHVKAFSERIGMQLLSSPEDLQKTFDERRPYRDAVYSLPRADGAAVYVSSAAQPRFGDDGAFFGYIGWTRNITTEFLAQQALKAGEQRFRDFAESASDWFWEADENLRYSWLSERAAALSGVGHAGIVGMRMGDGDDIYEPGELQRFRDAIESRAPFKDVLFSLATANGEIWVRQSGVPIRDVTGRFAGYRGVCRNVTVEIEARRALEQSRQGLEAVNQSLELEVAQRTQEIKARTEFLDDVVASLPDGLVVFDENFRITARNDACIEISGMPAQ
ncbi:MAG: PAS domain S-box protein, partial [Parvularculaceae bacterium]|nr:PAS domain S-box protein [Parvularculaceae bacterium]